MVIYGSETVAEFGKKHAAARKPLARFLEIAEQAVWKHFPDVKATFPATDYVSKTGVLIFDIAGNNYRMFARVDFEEQLLWIDSVMTHKEYERKGL